MIVVSEQDSEASDATPVDVGERTAGRVPGPPGDRFAHSAPACRRAARRPTYSSTACRPRSQPYGVARDPVIAPLESPYRYDVDSVSKHDFHLVLQLGQVELVLPGSNSIRRSMSLSGVSSPRATEPMSATARPLWRAAISRISWRFASTSARNGRRSTSDTPSGYAKGWRGAARVAARYQQSRRVPSALSAPNATNMRLGEVRERTPPAGGAAYGPTSGVTSGPADFSRWDFARVVGTIIQTDALVIGGGECEGRGSRGTDWAQRPPNVRWWAPRDSNPEPAD